MAKDTNLWPHIRISSHILQSVATVATDRTGFFSVKCPAKSSVRNRIFELGQLREKKQEHTSVHVVN